MKTVLLLYLLLPFVLFAQGYFPAGARSNAMANSSVALSDPWSFHHNPGATAGLTQKAVGISYENRFLLRELQSQGFVYIQPAKKGVWSFGVQSYGYTNFRTFRGGLGYSMKLSEKFFTGLQMNYQSLRLSDFYGTKHAVTAEFGLFYVLTEKWRMGMSLFNLGRTKLSAYRDERFSTVMRLGTSYSFSDKLTLAAEVEKTLEFPLRLKTGMEYMMVKQFCLRAGVSTQPMEVTFGFGYKTRAFQIDFGSAYDRLLGWSPHFGLTYSSTK